LQRKIRILFLSANPDDATQLKVAEECNLIDSRIQGSKFRDQFHLEQRHAVSLAELQSHLLRFKPNIVHFSGHGSMKGPLIFENSNGKAEVVSPKALSSLFRIINDDTSDKDDDRVCCVVLSACYSLQQAEAISKHVDFVIGISDAIKDTSATNFAASFYQALCYGKSIQTSYELGRNQLELYEDSDEQILNLVHRPLLDPSKVFLASDKTPEDDESKVIDNLETEKRKENLSEHCSKLLKESQFETSYYDLRFVDLNETYYEVPIFQYGRQIIEHLYTGHKPLYDLLVESGNAHQATFQKQEECREQIKESLKKILSEYDVKVGNSTDDVERRIDAQSFSNLAVDILTFSEKNTNEKFIWKDDRSWPLTWGDRGYILYGIEDDLKEKITTSLNDFVDKNHYRFIVYFYLRENDDDLFNKFTSSFDEFISNIRLGTAELSGGCKSCLSSKFHDEKEISKLRNELGELSIKKT